MNKTHFKKISRALTLTQVLLSVQSSFSKHTTNLLQTCVSESTLIPLSLLSLCLYTQSEYVESKDFALVD